MKIKKKTERKIFDVYIGAVVEITEGIISGQDEFRKPVSSKVSDMINEFTGYVMSFGSEVMTNSEHAKLNNIINSALLDISNDVESYSPGQAESLKVTMCISMMISESNRLVAKALNK